MVSVKNLTVSISGTILLNDISCTLLPGTITSFVGPSGAGKTTLLKSIAGLIRSKQGEIVVDGKQLDDCTSLERAEKIGYVFQDFNLFPHMTVLGNCSNPQVMHGRSVVEAEAQARSILKDLGMESFVSKYPSELSGGQKQRVAIARALCLQPKVLLLDEPTASLDPVNTDILVGIIKNLASSGFSIGLSTQDMSFASKVFDRVYYLEGGTIAEFCEGKEGLAGSAKIAGFVKV